MLRKNNNRFKMDATIILNNNDNKVHGPSGENYIRVVTGIYRRASHLTGRD